MPSVSPSLVRLSGPRVAMQASGTPSSPSLRGPLLLAMISFMKLSRRSETSPSVPSTTISGDGSRATFFTPAQGPESTEISSPTLLSLARHPPVTPPNRRIVSASSPELKTGNVSCSSSVRIVSASIPLLRLSAISQ